MPALNAIARKLSAWLADSASAAKWLLLCVEPGLARVPWQALIARHGAAPTVSLIPSFSWFVRHGGSLSGTNSLVGTGGIRLPADDVAFSSLPSGVRHPALGELLVRFRKDSGHLKRRYPETMFVLGHGLWDESAKRTTLATAISPPTADSHLDEVLALARARVVVLHACYGGYNVAAGLGDLGGLAGICLAARGRLFVGALSQVSPQTAGLLHRHLQEAAAGCAVGDTYRKAIAEDERVAQYSLFGLPWETGSAPRR